MHPIQIALWIVLGVALLISVVTDVLSGRILDLVTYPTLVVALILRLVWAGVGDLENGLLSGLLCAGAMGGFFALLAWRGKMGWGDVKLMAVAGAVFGYPLAMAALIFTSLAGALQALVTLLWQGKFWEMLQGWGRRWAVRARLLPKDTEIGLAGHIPYGVAIAVGCVWTMWWDRSGNTAP